MSAVEDIEAVLALRGWQRDLSGTWTRLGAPSKPSEIHEHSATCTAESCGPSERFYCDGDCARVLRRDGDRRPCMGHPLPSREALVKYSLRRKGLGAAAPAGTPLEDDDTVNTWSTERESVAPATRGRTA